MVLRSVLLQSTAKHHAQSVKVKMALTEDLIQNKNNKHSVSVHYMFHIAHEHRKRPIKIQNNRKDMEILIRVVCRLII